MEFVIFKKDFGTYYNMYSDERIAQQGPKTPKITESIIEELVCHEGKWLNRYILGEEVNFTSRESWYPRPARWGSLGWFDYSIGTRADLFGWSNNTQALSVYMTYIEPEHRSLSRFYQMYNKTLELAEEHGCQVIVRDTVVNPKLEVFLKREGFTDAYACESIAGNHLVAPISGLKPKKIFIVENHLVATVAGLEEKKVYDSTQR